MDFLSFFEKSKVLFLFKPLKEDSFSSSIKLKYSAIFFIFLSLNIFLHIGDSISLFLVFFDLFFKLFFSCSSSKPLKKSSLLLDIFFLFLPLLLYSLTGFEFSLFLIILEMDLLILYPFVRSLFELSLEVFAFFA